MAAMASCREGCGLLTPRPPARSIASFRGLRWVILLGWRMSLGSVDPALQLVVRELVEKNKERIFPGAASLRVESVEFGKSSTYRGTNFHLPLTVHAKADNESYDAELWLKS